MGLIALAKRGAPVAGALLLLTLAACAEAPKAQLANPASVNCGKLGGILKIETKPGGEIGVCYFEDNRQCEEWALYRGQCRVGGVKVTGYATRAARYCAITGGKYTFTAPGTDSTSEQGACTLPSGKLCDVHAYYEGHCR